MRLVCGLSLCWEDDYTCGASAVLCGQTLIVANATFYWVKRLILTLQSLVVQDQLLVRV
jgi:hypothetical protein